jgi:hypothetical protein
MNIVSDFRDYYDIGLSYGIDKSLTYIRRTEHSNGELLIPNLKQKTGWGKSSWRKLICSNVLKIPADFHSSRTGDNWAIPNHNRLTGFFVGFCGKFYPMLRFRVNENLIDEAEYDYLYSEESVLDALDKAPFNNRFSRSRASQWLYLPSGDRKTDLEMALTFIRKGPIECIEPFANLKTPNMVICLNSESYFESPLIINANLDELKFGRCVDAYTAFQELSMFIGGVLGVGEPDTIEISDTDMRDAKGFNDRSFKKEPGKKMRKKK